MTLGLWSVPPSWTWAHVSDLGEVVSGGTPSTKDGSFWGDDVVWFSPADLTGYSAKFIRRGKESLSKRGLQNSSARVMPAGSVMFSSRAPIGYVAINEVDAATNQGFKSVVPGPALFNEYLYYYLKASKQLAEERATGTTFKEISGSAFSLLPVPLAPRHEQHRIVAKIQELFSELDKAVESLRLARAQLGTYRQALLKAAFEGRLTADWRAANPDKLEPPETLLARIRAERETRRGELERRALRPLPEGWVWVTVQEAGDVQLGRQRAPQHHTGEHIRPYLRVANVLEDALDLCDVKEMNFTPKEYETFALRDGDVLLNEGQAPDLLGRPAIYRDQIPGCCFQKTLLRFRPGMAVNSEFALIVFRHYMRSGRFKKESRITTNIGHLTQVRFVVMEFPVPDQGGTGRDR